MASALPKVNEAALRLFSTVAFDAANSTRDEADKDLLKIEENLLMKYQVVVKPEAFYAMKEIEAHVKLTMRTAEELNSTFYRRYNDVISKTRPELLRDKFIYYWSVFGPPHGGAFYAPITATSFTADPATIPANSVELDLPDEELSITGFGTMDQSVLKEKCWSLISGGTALSGQTVFDCIEILDWTKAELDISKVRNREARTLLLSRHLNDANARDCEPEEFLRAAVYAATGGLLLIKNVELLQSIKLSERNDVSRAFANYGVSKLAKIFNRFKPIFVAFKLANPKNGPVVNRISKLSKREHKPMVQNPLNAVTYRTLSVPSELHWLKSATLPALLRALNVCHLAMHEQEKPGLRYHIRNGKSWTADTTRSKESREIAAANFETILSHLEKTIGERFRGKRIYIPDWIEYGLPVSDKQFVGNVPFNTRFRLPSTKNVAVGAFWDKTCRCGIVDVSGLTSGGKQIAWNRSFKEGAFVYSGDMVTISDLGAAEYIMCRSTTDYPDDGDVAVQIRINLWSGNGSDHEYDIIVGEGDGINKDYMINPANRMVNLRYRSQSRMSTIGYLLREGAFTEFLLSPGKVGNFKEATSTNRNREQLLSNSLRHALKHSLSLNWLLSKLGAIVVNEVSEGENVDFDLSLEKINRDFFNLLKEDWTIVV